MGIGAVGRESPGPHHQQSEELAIGWSIRMGIQNIPDFIQLPLSGYTMTGLHFINLHGRIVKIGW